jgi:hypothetical protein
MYLSGIRNPDNIAYNVKKIGIEFENMNPWGEDISEAILRFLFTNSIFRILKFNALWKTDMPVNRCWDKYTPEPSKMGYNPESINLDSTGNSVSSDGFDIGNSQIPVGAGARNVDYKPSTINGMISNGLTFPSPVFIAPGVTWKAEIVFDYEQFIYALGQINKMTSTVEGSAQRVRMAARHGLMRMRCSLFADELKYSGVVSFFLLKTYLLTRLTLLILIFLIPLIRI